MYHYKVEHCESLICTKLGHCHNFKTIQRKNLRFLPLHRPYKFLCTNLIIMPIFTFEWCEILKKWFLKRTLFKVTTLTSNNSKNIRAWKKVEEIICSSTFFLFNGVFCSSLLSTVTAARGRKDDCKKLSWSTWHHLT